MAHPRLAKFKRPLQPRRPPTEIRQEEEEGEEQLIRQAEERPAKSAPRGSLKRATLAAAMANIPMRDRVREAAAEARAAHDSWTTTSSSEIEPSLAHKSCLRAKPSGRRVSGKQQLSEAVNAHAQTKKVRASAVAEAKRVMRDAKDVSAKPQAVPEQAAKDQVAKETDRHRGSRQAAGRHGESGKGSGRQGADHQGAGPQAAGRHRRGWQ